MNRIKYLCSLKSCMKNLIIIIITSIIFQSCDRVNKKLRLVNRSNSILYYELSFNNEISEDDYLIPIPNGDTVWPDLVKNSSSTGWEYRINHSNDSTLYIYFLHHSSVTDEIIAKKDYIKVGYKVKDLERLNWIVIYTDSIK